MRYFNIEKFPQYDISSNKISRYFQNIEILPSTRAHCYCNYITYTNCFIEFIIHCFYMLGMAQLEHMLPTQFVSSREPL